VGEADMSETEFFASIREKPFGGHMTEEQVAGVNAVIDACDKFPKIVKDRRWKAYMLATAKWETAQTMTPIREYGEGHGKAYGTTYYGRGYVQLTWEANYAKAETELRKIGVDVNLVQQPDLALEPAIAAPIMILGMVQGWFTGKRLSDYFGAFIDDWTGARRIINGQDRAKTIASYGLAFNAALVKFS
jgi:putative chitinase